MQKWHGEGTERSYNSYICLVLILRAKLFSAVALLPRPAVRRYSFMHSGEICITTIRVLILTYCGIHFLRTFCVIYVCNPYLPCFQFTAAGVAGLRGPTVTNRATVETRQENACVIILNQLLAGKAARVRKLKLSPVIWTAVQVFIYSLRLNMILYEG